MTFNSPAFLLFLLGVLILHGIVPKSIRWLVLLTASYCFYAWWNWQALWVLGGVTLVSYFAARQMQTLASPSRRKVWLAAGVLATLGSLLVFKYFNYSLVVLNGMFDWRDRSALPLLEMAAPMGISFFALQVFAYLVDVFRGQAQAETHLGKYALSVAFFPQTVAGPITRVNKLLPQIHQPEATIPTPMYTGLFRIAWGGIQKFVIADRLAALISPVFDDPQSYNSASLVLVLYLFAVQLYQDFAGYSNIAIGLGRLFGLKLAENFNLPFLARDITDFWNRWHISLTHWLRDYIFYPAMRQLRKWGLPSASLWGMLIPPVVTMLVSGVWHGPGTHYLLWGLYHGVLLALSAATARWRKKVTESLKPVWRSVFSSLQVLLTFQFVVVGWVFFRLPSEGAALAFLRQIATGADGTPLLNSQTAAMVSVLLLLFMVMEFARVAGLRLDPLPKLPKWGWWVLAYLLLFLMLFMGNFEGSQPFIYERF